MAWNDPDLAAKKLFFIVMGGVAALPLACAAGCCAEPCVAVRMTSAVAQSEKLNSVRIVDLSVS